MKVQALFMALVVFVAVSISAEAPPRVGDARICLPGNQTDIATYGSPWITDDRNNDGIVDHAVQYGKNGKMVVAEVFDYNFDGKMDDFYTYDNGVLILEELDTNYDGLVDIWVHVYKGVYVAAYERDSNFDGTLDIVKQYGKESIVKR